MLENIHNLVYHMLSSTFELWMLSIVKDQNLKFLNYHFHQVINFLVSNLCVQFHVHDNMQHHQSIVGNIFWQLVLQTFLLLLQFVNKIFQ